MERAKKACAVPYRTTSGTLEILAFRHPLAGHQLVKGTIEAGETPLAAAVRELREESGVDLSSPAIPLGRAAIGHPPVSWFFVAFAVPPLPDRWDHATADDGGRVFSFFWHPLQAEPDGAWHPIFCEALDFIRRSALGRPR